MRFGFGGINVHAILEELPEETSQNWSRPYHLPVRRETELFAWAADSPELTQFRNCGRWRSHWKVIFSPTLAELSAAVLRNVDQSRPCKLALLSDRPRTASQCAAEVHYAARAR